MKISIFLGIAALAAVWSVSCSAGETQERREPCDAEVLDKAGSWTVTHGEHTGINLRKLDCLAADDLVELAEGESSGSLTIMYLDRPDPLRQIPCPSRSKCSKPFRVRASPLQVSSAPGFAQQVLDFVASFRRSQEPGPIPGILRGLITLLPSVLCVTSNATIDLSAALSRTSGKYNIGFLRTDAGQSLAGVFPLRFDNDQKPYIDEFRLSPGLYLIDVRDSDDMLEGQAYSLIASLADCSQLLRGFELARQYTATWPKDVPTQAVLNFQSVYLQALAHDATNAPIQER